MYSVLIAAYKRPQLLKAIIEGIPKSIDKIYIHVDRSEEKNDLNSEVIRLAQNFRDEDSRISIKIASSNLGPGRAIPSAVNWALEGSNTVLVLEDDCIPNASAYEYFRLNSNLISENFIVCGTSPFDFQANRVQQTMNTTSTYALVSGWMIGEKTWNELDIDCALDLRYAQILCKSLGKPRLLLPLSFFYASIIRIRRGEVWAWDSMFCLSMIMHDIHSVMPNVTLIDNLGFDSVASNTKAPEDHVSNVYNKSSEFEPAQKVDFSRSARERTDSLIKVSVYNMSIRNYLSPAKSFLRAYRRKL